MYNLRSKVRNPKPTTTNVTTKETTNRKRAPRAKAEPVSVEEKPKQQTRGRKPVKAKATTKKEAAIEKPLVVEKKDKKEKVKEKNDDYNLPVTPMSDEEHDPGLDATLPMEDFVQYENQLKRKNDDLKQDDNQTVEEEKPAKKLKVESSRVPDIPSVGGKVMTFGDDMCGELGLKETAISKKRPVPIDIDATVVQIVCGGMHSICSTDDGQMYSWGCNDEKALGRVTENPPEDRNLEAEPTKVPFSNKVVKVCAGDSHSAALTTTGQIYIWGNFKDSNGSIGIKADSDNNDGQVEPFQIEVPNATFVDLASGVDHLLLLTDTGVIYSIGSGEQGQLGRIEKSKWKEVKENKEIYLKPDIVKFDNDSTICDRVWAGQYSSFARTKTGEIYAWGLNNYSNLGIPQKNTDPEDLQVPYPILIPSFSKFNSQVEQIIQGQHFMLARDSKGKVYSCGRHEYGRLGHGKTDDSFDEPKLIEKLNEETITCIAAGSTTSFAVSDKGYLYAWGMGGASLGLGDDDAWEPARVESKNLTTHSVISVSAGSQHTVIIAIPKTE